MHLVVELASPDEEMRPSLTVVCKMGGIKINQEYG
jgi:hypothetical protein